MHRMRLTGYIAACTLIVVGFVIAISPKPGGIMAQDPQPTPTVPAADPYVRDLESRISALATEIAQLAGPEDEVVVGRLGGRREGFDQRFGRPVAFLDDGTVTFALENGLLLDLATADGRATSVVIRTADGTALTPDAALNTLALVVPADVIIVGSPASEMSTMTLQSDALGRARAKRDRTGCSATAANGFTVAYAYSGDGTIASVTTAVTESEVIAMPQPTKGDRSARGASAVANTSLGGVVAVNGLKIRVLDVDRAPSLEAPLPDDTTAVAFKVEFTNDSRRPLRLSPENALVVDADAMELVAICAGPQPSLIPAEIAPGETVTGWITFAIPADFVAQRFVLQSDDVRVGFSLD